MGAVTTRPIARRQFLSPPPKMFIHSGVANSYWGPDLALRCPDICSHWRSSNGRLCAVQDGVGWPSTMLIAMKQ